MHGRPSGSWKAPVVSCLLVSGDIKDPNHCRDLIAKPPRPLGRIDILVNNAAHQASFDSPEEISDEEWDVTFRTNIHAMFYLTKAALRHMQPGAAIINTTSVNADAQVRSFWPMRRPKVPSRTSRADWHSFLPSGASGSIVLRRDRSGRP